VSTACDVLNGSREAFDREGWTPGTLGDVGGPACLMGGIAKAAGLVYSFPSDYDDTTFHELVYVSDALRDVEQREDARIYTFDADKVRAAAQAVLALARAVDPEGLERRYQEKLDSNEEFWTTRYTDFQLRVMCAQDTVVSFNDAADGDPDDDEYADANYIRTKDEIDEAIDKALAICEEYADEAR
jgi:hypothetical protein